MIIIDTGTQPDGISGLTEYKEPSYAEGQGGVGIDMMQIPVINGGKSRGMIVNSQFTVKDKDKWQFEP